jgi:ABC-type transport system substrate-binding protein
VGYDTKDGPPRPEIAESWETSWDRRVWRFHIRRGVTWQDGRPLTAKDVAFSPDCIVENQLGSYATYTERGARTRWWSDSGSDLR